MVIGGTGFIGHHLLRAAQKKKWQMTSVSLNPPSSERFVHSVRYLHFDLACYSPGKKYFVEEFDYVVNLGGYINHQLYQMGGRDLVEIHFNILKNLLEILPRHKLKRFVQIGTSDEYGNAPAPQHEGLREKPISPYSYAKVACTHFLQMLHRTENFPAVILRPFLIYGPGQDPSRFLPQVIQGCLRDETFPTSEGKQLRDFCYVDDAVRTIMQALIIPGVEGEIFNVAVGEPISIRYMIEMVCNLIGAGQPDFGGIPYRPFESMELFADLSKTINILKCEPLVGINLGLQRTIRWYSNGK